MRYLRGYLIFLPASLAAAVAVYAWAPSYRELLVREDGVLENLTAVAYLCAVVLALWIRRESGRYKLLLLGISAGALVAFLDEISFGERIFGFTMPEFRGVKLDATHDVFFLAQKGFEKLLEQSALWLLVPAVLVALSAALAIRYRSLLGRVISAGLRQPPVVLAAVFFALAIVVTLLDLHILRTEHRSVLEETLEMNAAVALIFCCLSCRGSASRSLSGSARREEGS